MGHSHPPKMGAWFYDVSWWPKKKGHTTPTPQVIQSVPPGVLWWRAHPFGVSQHDPPPHCDGCRYRQRRAQKEFEHRNVACQLDVLLRGPRFWIRDRLVSDRPALEAKAGVLHPDRCQPYGRQRVGSDGTEGTTPRGSTNTDLAGQKQSRCGEPSRGQFNGKGI